jgi:hypothetical protein
MIIINICIALSAIFIIVSLEQYCILRGVSAQSLNCELQAINAAVLNIDVQSYTLYIKTLIIVI